ncbi:MAG: hypothetical protein JSW54_04520, partial [Fidelibacterota bacterium]
MRKHHIGAKFSILTIAVLCLVLAQASYARETATQDSLRIKIGQMIMTHFYGSAPSEEILTDITDQHLGGVILYRFLNLPNRTLIPAMTTQLQDGARIPLFVSIDQEPGTAQNLNLLNGFSNAPTAYQLGSMDNEFQTRNVARTFASWFIETGININLAPVVDLRIQPANVIGDRAFSIDPAVVTRNAYWFIDEFRQAGLMTTLKHFPGHGSSVGDSHIGFTDVTATWTATELEPYRALIDSGVVDMIMTAHVFNSNIDSLHPATLSFPTVSGILRDSLGFDGVIITDEMSMGAISANYSMEEAFVLAVNAGVDILLYLIGNDPEGRTSIGYIVDLLEAEVLDGTIPASRIDESYRRIMALKNRYLSSDLVYAQGAQVDRSHIRPSIDSLTISASVDNSDQHDLAVHSILYATSGIPLDTVEMHNDGQHGDGSAGDSLWAARWATGEEQTYLVSVRVQDFDAATSRTLPNAARFTSVGPVVCIGDSLVLRSRPVDSYYP